MAKHFIKDKDGHLMELSDDEYKERKRKGCFWETLGIIGIIIAVAIFGGKDDKSDNDSTKQTQSSANKEIVVSDKSNSKENKKNTSSNISSANLYGNDEIKEESIEYETDMFNTEIEAAKDDADSFDE